MDPVVLYESYAVEPYYNGTTGVPVHAQGIMGEGHFGAAVWAPPIRRWTTGHRAVSAPDISAPFPIFFFRIMKKKQ